MYGIFTYIGVIFRVNVGKYVIPGAFGTSFPVSCGYSINEPESGMKLQVVQVAW